MQEAQNYVSIYKNNVLIVNNQLVNDVYENSFIDSGEYKVIINSKSDRDEYLGTKAYYFNIESYMININEPKWSFLPESQKRTLSVNFNPVQEGIGKQITWSSSNTDVATINSSSGEVTAVSEGITTITASDGEKSCTYTLNVKGVLGDIDNDKTITSYDAYKALLLSVNQSLGNQYEDEVVVLDVDRDSDMTAWDAYRILIYSIGTITTF